MDCSDIAELQFVRFIKTNTSSLNAMSRVIEFQFTMADKLARTIREMFPEYFCVRQSLGKYQYFAEKNCH